jgi:hypothetical protein
MVKSENMLSQKVLPLHPAQEGIYYDQMLQPQSSKYNIGCYQVVDDTIDTHLAKKTWALLYKNIDSLRLCFTTDTNDTPSQYIKNPEDSDVLIQEIDFSLEGQPEKVAHDWMQVQLNKPVSLFDNTCYQVALLKINKSKYFLFVCTHHILMDGMAIYRLLEWFKRLYHDLGKGESISWLSDLPQYSTQVEKSQRYIGSPSYERDKKYWEDFLTSNEPHSLQPYSVSEGSRDYTVELPASLNSRITQY